MELEMELKRLEEAAAVEFEYEKEIAADVGLLDQKEALRSKRWYWCGRRAQDIFCSSLALLVLWPVILFFAIAVVIDNPGASPFFVQERIGRKGSRSSSLSFDVWKWIQIQDGFEREKGCLRCSFESNAECI